MGEPYNEKVDVFRWAGVGGFWAGVLVGPGEWALGSCTMHAKAERRSLLFYLSVCYCSIQIKQGRTI